MICQIARINLRNCDLRLGKASVAHRQASVFQFNFTNLFGSIILYTYNIYNICQYIINTVT